MNKVQYIAALTSTLRGKLAQREIDDIVRDYNEFFEDGKLQNRTEEEVAEELGNPIEVAKQLLSEERFTPPSQSAKIPNIDFDGIKDKFTEGMGKMGDNVRASSARRKAEAPHKSYQPYRDSIGGFWSFMFKFICVVMMLPAVMVVCCLILAFISVAVAGVIGVFAAIVALSAISPIIPSGLMACAIIWILFGIAFSITVLLGCVYFGKSFLEYVAVTFFDKQTVESNTGYRADDFIRYAPPEQSADKSESEHKTSAETETENTEGGNKDA